MNLAGFVIFAAYAALFVGTLFAVFWWDRRQRRIRRPLPENLKLMRMPGEHLWRRASDHDEKELLDLMVSMMTPLVVAGAVLYLCSKILRLSDRDTIIVTVTIFALALLLCVRWFLSRLRRRADDYLGFFGERYVAEWLDPLKAQGWSIVHDVSATERLANSISIMSLWGREVSGSLKPRLGGRGELGPV